MYFAFLLHLESITSFFSAEVKCYATICTVSFCGSHVLLKLISLVINKMDSTMIKISTTLIFTLLNWQESCFSCYYSILKLTCLSVELCVTFYGLRFSTKTVKLYWFLMTNWVSIEYLILARVYWPTYGKRKIPWSVTNHHFLPISAVVYTLLPW